MRKPPVAIALLAATSLVTGGVLWFRAAFPMPDAAELVPSDTLMLADFPDLPATATRWRETDLAGMLNEPELQAFFAKPRARLANHPVWSGLRENVGQIKPRRAFLAVTSLANNMPRAVGGFAFAAQRKEMESLLAKVRAQAQSASPQGKLEHLLYRQFQIETFSDDGITLAGCFAKNWYFFANDVELLKATLDRFSGQLLKSNLAAGSNVYRASQSPLPTHADFRLFIQSNALSDKLLADLSGDSGQLLDSGDAAVLQKIRAVALATRLEGKRIRDTLFLYEPEAALRPKLSGKTLELTSTNTLLYAAMAPVIPDDSGAEAKPGIPSSGRPLRTLLTALAPPPATLSQFKSAFGPEHALLLEWPPDDTQPNLFLALEVRQPEAARKFMETVFRAWSRADEAGISLWALPLNAPMVAQIHPAVALTAHHAMAGLSLESLKPFASNATKPPAGRGTLAQSPAFLGAISTVGQPQIGVIYLDAKPLFERFYALLRPAALLWGNLGVGGEIADLTQLPPAETISRHLSPICLSATQTGSGTLMESTGPVTALQVGAGIAVGAGMTFLQVQAGATPTPLFPSPPAKPLSAPSSGSSPAPSEGAR